MRRVFVLAVALMLLASACGGGDDQPVGARGPTEVRVVTHESFAASQTVLDEFTMRSGISIRLIPSGDAGAALNQAILTKRHPLGDVFFGVDNTFLSRALDEGIFLPYRPEAIELVDPRYDLDAAKHRVVPIDHGEVCVNFDKRWLAEHQVPVPKRLEDLAEPAYRSLLVVENPATSSPGLAFLLATIAKFGDPGWQDFWERLRANDVSVVPGWEQAYNSSFSGGSGRGPRPLVVSYGSSPPAELVFAADPKPAEPSTGVLEDSCFSQIEFAGVLRGTKKEAAARKVIDFFLSREFQEDLPLQMFVFPVRRDATLPEVFDRFAARPATPLSLPAGRIGANRERWISEWSRVVLG